MGWGLAVSPHLFLTSPSASQWRGGTEGDVSFEKLVDYVPFPALIGCLEKAVSVWINNCQSQRATKRLKREQGCWICVLFDDDEGPSVRGQISVGGTRLRETRFRCPWATSVIVFPSPPTITELWSSLLSVSCSYQGPHQGIPLLNVCPPLRGHHQINKINKSNSWQDWSKDSMLTPWPIPSRQINQTQMRSHGNKAG